VDALKCKKLAGWLREMEMKMGWGDEKSRKLRKWRNYKSVMWAE